MSTESNKDLVRRWIAEGWNGRNLDIVDEVYAADVVQYEPSSPAPVTSSEELKHYIGGFQTAFPDLHFSIDDLVADGEKVVWRFTARGTHGGTLMAIPPTGKSITVTGIVIFRVAAGRLAEVWVNFDTLGMLQQIGVIPAPQEVAA